MLTDADFQDLRPFVEEWHKQALRYIGTKPIEDTWADFIHGWKRVEFPKGREPIRQVFERALQSEPPPEAQRYDSEPMHKLICLCRAMQKCAGKGIFFLSCRMAGSLIGISHEQVAKYLKVLDAHGFLELIEQGGQKHNPRKASRYRYLGTL